MVAQDDELLVVRPPGPHPHVEEAQAAGGIDLLAQAAVLLGGESQSANISRSPLRICDTRRCNSAKYVAPWMSGRTRLPSVHATPSG